MNKYQGNELKYIQMVLNEESWSGTGGTFVEQLEKEFAKKFGVNFAIAFNSGTSTLHAALLALGVGPGDEVVVPSLGPIMTSAAVVHAGATPVFADVNTDTFNINPWDIKKKITRRTKAIIPVHLYGYPCELEELSNYGIPFIEDCAQAFLSYYDTFSGKKLLCGTMGKFGSFSFESSKHISCGEGGMLITNDEELALKARRIGGHGFAALTASSGRIRANPEIFRFPDYKRHSAIGYNYRLSEFQAAIALAQLERLDEIIRNRVHSALCLWDAMDMSESEFYPQPYEGNSFYTLAAKYNASLPAWRIFRDRFISLGGHPFYAAWSVPYLEPAFRNFHFTQIPNCPNAEMIQPKIMQFKTSWDDLDDAKRQAEIFEEAIL
jgi:perosamine synthetase